MDERRGDSIEDWKKYLTSKGISIDSESSFNRAMQRLDARIALKVPSAKHMIWHKGQVNPKASIADVDAALGLLSKFGQANLDDLGSPSDPERFSGTPLNSMFKSQDDANTDGFSPGHNQNQSREGSSVPSKIHSSGKEKPQKTPQKEDSVDRRMKQLTNLIENVKK